jgi:hypothetical protein
MSGPCSTVLAAVENDVLAGTAMVGHDGNRGWVYSWLCTLTDGVQDWDAT